MTDVFISYSRQNLEFAEQLFAALEKRGFSAWVDWQNIPRSAGWWDEIKRGIDTASTFVYIMSNDSLGSAVCTLELSHAIGNGKRIIPVVIEQPNFEAAFGKIAAVQPDEILSGMLAGRDLLITARANRGTIGHINWVFFGKTPQGEDKPYDYSLEELIETVNTDLEHNRRHARLLVRAREWENGHKADDLLLIGDEIGVAETWLSEADRRTKTPTPTDLQRAYITQSRAVENRRRRVLRSLQVSAIVAATITIIAFVVTAILTSNAQSNLNAASTEVSGAQGTLAQIPATLESADTQVAGANTEVADAQGTLTQIPPTLDTIATDVQAQRRVSDSLRLANEAEKFSNIGQPLLALSLALEAAKIPEAPALVEKTLADLAYGPGMKSQLIGHTRNVTSVAFSPDSRYALSGEGSYGERGEIILWDITEKKEIRRLIGHRNSVNSVTFSPDGRLALSGSADATVILWDADTGEILRMLRGHITEVTSVSFGPDGRLALSGALDGMVIVWDAVSGDVLWRLRGHTDQINNVSFSPDGRFAVSGSSDRAVIVWDVSSGKMLRKLQGHFSEVEAVAFSPDGRHVISGGGVTRNRDVRSDFDDNSLVVWDVSKGELLRRLYGHTDNVTSVAFSPDGRFALSGGLDGTLIYWDVETGEQLWTMRGHTGSVTSVTLSADGKLALSGSDDKSVIVWDIPWRLPGHTDTISSVAVSPDGRLALSGSHDHSMKVWDIATGTLLRTLYGHLDEINSVAFSPDGRLALSGSGVHVTNSDDRVLVWEVATGKQLQSFEGHDRAVMGVAFSPDGRLALSGAGYEEIFVWDVVSGHELRSLCCHTWLLSSIAFSPDGQLVFSGTAYGELIVWDVASGVQKWEKRGHSDDVTGVGFSPDSRFALSASRDNTIVIWDAKTGDALQTLRGHTDDVNDAVFSPKGRFVVSGSSDETVIVWDWESGEELRKIRGQASAVTSVAISADGRYIVSGSENGGLNVWHLDDKDALIARIESERLIRPLTCTERRTFSIQPSCVDPTLIPTPDMTAVTTTPTSTLPPVIILTYSVFDWTPLPFVSPEATSITTPTPSNTMMATIDLTQSTATPTRTQRPSPSVTPNLIPTQTAFDWTPIPITLPAWTPIDTLTPSITPTATITRTPTVDITQTTMTPSLTPSLTWTPWPTHTWTPSSTPEITGEALIGQNHGEVPAGGKQIWVFEGIAGERLTISTDAKWDTILRVRDNRYQVLRENFDAAELPNQRNSRIIIMLARAGTLYIEVRGNSASDAGAYTLIIESNRAADVTLTPTP